MMSSHENLLAQVKSIISFLSRSLFYCTTQSCVLQGRVVSVQGAVMPVYLAVGSLKTSSAPRSYVHMWYVPPPGWARGINSCM